MSFHLVVNIPFSNAISNAGASATGGEGILAILLSLTAGEQKNRYVLLELCLWENISPFFN